VCRYGKEVSVLEMDGQFDNLEELIYVESHLSNTSAKFYGEITQQMLSNSAFPGSQNGTGKNLLSCQSSSSASQFLQCHD
jgi:phosphoribulokinase